MSVTDKYTTLNTEKIPQVHEAGKHAEYTALWREITQNGGRTTYQYGFAGYSWTDVTFNPPETLRPINARSMFYLSSLTSVSNSQVDFSNATDMRETFLNSRDLTSLTLAIGDNNKTFNANTFGGCEDLTDLTIIGTINDNNFNVQWSENLTHDSLLSVINALVDKTGVSGTWTVTLGDVNIAKLTDAEQNIAINKGWWLG